MGTVKSKICPKMSGWHKNERNGRIEEVMIFCKKERCELWIDGVPTEESWSPTVSQCALRRRP